MNLKARNLHRDLGYFYIGLIISFALSGILMNHRDQFHAEKYNVETKNIEVKLPKKEAITEDFAKNIIKQFDVADIYRKHKIKGETLRISFKNTDVEVDINTVLNKNYTPLTQSNEADFHRLVNEQDKAVINSSVYYRSKLKEYIGEAKILLSKQIISSNKIEELVKRELEIKLREVIGVDGRVKISDWGKPIESVMNRL